MMPLSTGVVPFMYAVGGALYTCQKHCLGDHWTRFSSTKTQLMKHILALPNLQFNITLLFQMVTQELAIP